MTKQQLERVDRMTEPLVVGRLYMVPTVRGTWNRIARHWPVFGALHNDGDRFPFDADHYHIDARFLTLARHLIESNAFREPLHSHWDEHDLPKPIYRKLKCRRSFIPYPLHNYVQIRGIQGDWSGQQCPRGKAGWICPHRKASLGSIEPVDGVITCPLHGMRINAETGVVLPVQS